MFTYLRNKCGRLCDVLFSIGFSRSLGLVLAMFFAGVLGYWVTDHDPPLRLLKREVLTPSVTAGGMLRIRNTIDLFRRCAANNTRVLFDSEKVRYALPGEEFAVFPGKLGQFSYVVEVPIPAAAASGRAEITLISQFECNITHKLWPVTLVSDPVTFEVVPVRPNARAFMEPVNADCN